MYTSPLCLNLPRNAVPNYNPLNAVKSYYQSAHHLKHRIQTAAAAPVLGTIAGSLSESAISKEGRWASPCEMSSVIGGREGEREREGER